MCSEPPEERARISLHALAGIYSKPGGELPTALLNEPLFSAASRCDLRRLPLARRSHPPPATTDWPFASICGPNSITALPFVDVRDAGYHLLEAAAGCPPALPVLCAAAGCLDRLLDLAAAGRVRVSRP